MNLELAINDVTITEGDSGTRTADFTVTLTAGSNVQVKVDFAAANGSATAGSDYQAATSGTLTLTRVRPRSQSASSSTAILVFESNETFLVNLSNPVNATINDAQGVGTISNDDAQGGFISFSQSSFSIGESGGGITITVNRTNDISGAATVDYATVGRRVARQLLARPSTALPRRVVISRPRWARCDSRRARAQRPLRY